MKTRLPLPRNLARSYSMHIRVRPAERRRITRDAKAAGLSLSEFSRQKLLSQPARETADNPTSRPRLRQEEESPG